MASYVTPKKNAAFRMYLGVLDQSNTKLFKANPTIAAGDFKVSTDGGALANLTTLPAVTPASSRMIQIDFSASEMNGDNVTLVGVDAAGAEWCDVMVNIQTSARQIDDLAYPTVSGRSLDVSATGEAGIDWANVGTPSSTVSLSATTVATVTTATNLTTNNDKTGYALSSAGIQAIWDALTSAFTTFGSIGKLLVTDIDAAISTRLSTTGAPGVIWGTLTSALTTVGSIGKLLVDNINATIGSRAATGDAMTLTAAYDAAKTAAAQTTADAIKAKTDSLTFTVAGQIDANIQYVNDVQVNGIGTAGNPWGP